MYRGIPERRARSLRARLLVAAALVSVVLVAGCGGSSSPGVSNVSSSSTSTSHSSTSSSDGGSDGAPSGGGGQPFAVQTANGPKALKFSECMRANGVPNFPDPNAQGVIAGKSDAGIDPSSPQFQNAQKACVKKYIGRGGAAPSPTQQAREQASALALSKCMRSHGEPGFPDPTFSSGGGAAIKLVDGSGKALDPDSPIFRKAQKECGSLLHIRPKSGNAGP